MDTFADTRIYGGKSMAVRRAERRAKFIEAGLTVFGGKGYAASSVADICAEAGLARSQFYSEFGSREDLLLGVYDAVQDDSQTAVVAALEREGADAEKALLTAAAMAALVRSVGDDPRRARIVFVEMIGVSSRVEKHRANRRALWAEFIAATIAERSDGGFTPPGGYKLATTAFLGALTELVHAWSTSDPRPPIDDLIAVITAVLNALVRQPAE
ncbi:TetR/AcrR family transcriptional regulator [Williamsia sp. 1135]|uniref:TetR/AcrR family transcriptional regulator n=1 Tax=Williamsia sp. 1135 TaxID=1889262 RepID=UPI000A101F96|nr:TetR/AcrR family transcriptional regulator [Williamsia sp. 1135]ORM33385.1 TetR family transcriptional regulator [Williamsia sp. 1135]